MNKGAQTWRGLSRWALLVVAMIGLIGGTAFADDDSGLAKGTYTHHDPDFTVSAPDGYFTVPVSGDHLYGFDSADPSDTDAASVTVTITRLHNDITRGTPQIPASVISNPTVTSVPWQGDTLDMVSGYTTDRDNNRFPIRVVQIPIKGEGIQILVWGSTGQETQADAAMMQFLGRVKGTSAWMTLTEKNDLYWTSVMGGCTVIGGVVFLVIFLKNKKMKKAALAKKPASPTRTQEFGGLDQL